MIGTRASDRGRRTRSSDRSNIWIVIGMLVVVEFYIRPSLVSGRGLPDFLLLALLLFSMRSRPGTAAVVGLLIGFVSDVLTPAHFGAGMLAHVLVGWGASWGRQVFFADNLLVNAGLFFLGTWLRNILLLTFSGTTFSGLMVEATVWAPVQGLTTAVAGVLLVMLFRDWLVVKARP